MSVLYFDTEPFDEGAEAPSGSAMDTFYETKKALLQPTQKQQEILDAVEADLVSTEVAANMLHLLDNNQ